MRQVQLADNLYEEAVQHANNSGFTSVEEFVADAVEQQLHGISYEDMDDFFTPEIIAQLDAAVAEARATRSLTLEEVDAFLDKRREEWLKRHPG